MTELLESQFAQLATEQWRLIRALGRLVSGLPPEKQERTASQVRYAESRLVTLTQGAGLRLETFEGRAFDPSLPVSAVNIDDFADGSALVIAETIEPAVIKNGQIIQLGRVALSTEGKDASRD